MSLCSSTSPALGGGGAHTSRRRIGSATTALADDTPVSPAEAEKIKAALEAMGCTGGKMEKESEGNAFSFEVDDAKCKDGEYDVKLERISR